MHSCLKPYRHSNASINPFGFFTFALTSLNSDLTIYLHEESITYWLKLVCLYGRETFLKSTNSYIETAMLFCRYLDITVQRLNILSMVFYQFLKLPRFSPKISFASHHCSSLRLRISVETLLRTDNRLTPQWFTLVTSFQNRWYYSRWPVLRKNTTCIVVLLIW